MYVLDKCDHAGVWNVDLALASFQIGASVDQKTALELFGDRIELLEGGRKWYVVDFVEYQTGHDIQSLNLEVRFHRSIAGLLIKYGIIDKGLYKGISNPYLRVKNKNKNKNKNKDKNTEDKREEKEAHKKHKYGEFNHVLLTEKEYKTLFADWGQDRLNEMIRVLDEGIEQKGYKYKNHNLTIRKWEKNQTDKKNNGDLLAERYADAQERDRLKGSL